jgi:hypothetical protein
MESNPKSNIVPNRDVYAGAESHLVATSSLRNELLLTEEFAIVIPPRSKRRGFRYGM